MIKVSITDGSLSSEGTAIAGLPFSNSIGFNPLRTNNAGAVATTRARAIDHDPFPILLYPLPICPRVVWVFRISFCSSRRAMTFARLSRIRFAPCVGNVVKVRDLRVLIFILHRLIEDEENIFLAMKIADHDCSST